jgi:hypothetical protein
MAERDKQELLKILEELDALFLKHQERSIMVLDDQAWAREKIEEGKKLLEGVTC